jgi:membrane associated rhomboid family serine protease
MSTQPPAEGVVPVCYRHPAKETYIRCQRCERPICPDCMRPAAVGFQCPNCVAEGARTTRSGRTAYGGERSANPALTSIVLIATNVVVWLLILVTGGRESRWVERLALIPDGRCVASDRQTWFPGVDSASGCRIVPGADWVPGVAEGAPWQLITSVFAHVEPWHIAFNMLALWFLGPQLEMAIGRARYLALYLLSGLAGSACVYWLSDDQVQTLGASGAIFGLMGGLLVVAFKVGGNYQQILTWIGINALITIVGSSFISWQGHLGGLLGGFAIAALLVYAPRARRTTWQVAGLAALAVALAVLFVVRTTMLI